MHREFLMGNEAIALGAIAAGVNFVSGYPGTPSTEILETIAKYNKDGKIYVEWSVNEKAGLETSAGASYSGARTLVTMKQVGLNVASDPLMSLAYIGVKGGMVIAVADDPGPISSQTEQDTRTFAMFSKLPCFDPSGAKEAYDMIQDAFDYSEKYHTPVIFRPTTRVCHGYASIDVKDEREYRVNLPDGFKKDSSKWVIFPRLSYNNHIKIEERNAHISYEFSDYSRNFISYECGDGRKKGIASNGISYTYVKEYFEKSGNGARLLKVSTPFPFPEKLALEFLSGLDEVLCIEELDPVIERALTYVCGKYGLKTKIYGKLSGNVKAAGENTIDSVCENIEDFLSKAPVGESASGISSDIASSAAFGNGVLEDNSKNQSDCENAPALPARPPVLCAGCPHRASFYAVKQAMKGKKTVYCGDIGCYTLGNAMPLDMVDTCLCMGAGINIAQGIGRIEPDTKCFAFVGDSTFFASGITGVVNAVYNQADMTLVVLDNSTTAMTGHQPHPGTGKTMMGDIVEKVSIEKILGAIGLTAIRTVNPLELDNAVSCIKELSEMSGVKAVIFKSPCIALEKRRDTAAIIDGSCINCKVCIKRLGCPGLVIRGDKVQIDSSLCTGCGLCAQVCPKKAIQLKRTQAVVS